MQPEYSAGIQEWRGEVACRCRYLSWLAFQFELGGCRRSEITTSDARPPAAMNRPSGPNVAILSPCFSAVMLVHRSIRQTSHCRDVHRIPRHRSDLPPIGHRPTFVALKSQEGLRRSLSFGPAGGGPHDGRVSAAGETAPAGSQCRSMEHSVQSRTPVLSRFSVSLPSVRPTGRWRERERMTRRRCPEVGDRRGVVFGISWSTEHVQGRMNRSP